MKRLLRFVTLLLAVCLCLGAVTAQAAQAWSEEYYRAMDFSEGLSGAEQVDLDEQCLEIMRRYQVDVALLAITSEEREGDPLSEIARNYYAACGFGYGEASDGFMVVYDTDTEEMVIEAVGRAGNLLSENDLDFICESAVGFRDDYGIWGVLYVAAKELDDHLAGNDAADPSGPDISRQPDGALPSWYPADVNAFVPFHNETAPRVVDTADIFTDAEERQMERRLAEIRSELDKDIVIFTDVSTYGFDRKIYAADFYDFNGYGCGPEYEGVCLMICMDPDDRGWWVCCTGSETMELYTDENADELDDVLYEYMAAGDYAEGVADWIENFRMMYLKGSPFVPAWMPDVSESFERSHNAELPRVTDTTGALNDAELAQLTLQAAQVADQYGVDVAVRVDRYFRSMSSQDYSDCYYYYNGLGYGEDFDGILLTALAAGGGTYWCRVSAEGTGLEHLTDVNIERLTSQCKDAFEGGDAYKGVSRWLRQVDGMYRTGRVPRTAASWGLTAIIEAVVAAVVGGVALLRARLGMRTAKIQTNADTYLVRDTLRAAPVEDRFIGATTSRTYSPVERSSSRSGGGGRSSYSGSSGRSHSGSGRSF